MLLLVGFAGWAAGYFGYVNRSCDGYLIGNPFSYTCIPTSKLIYCYDPGANGIRKANPIDEAMANLTGNIHPP